MKIALIDWGIGGLSVYKPLKKKYPYCDYIYISDSGSKPYGKLSEKQLISRLSYWMSVLKKQNVDLVILACNAASTVLIPLQKKFKNLKIVGLLEAGCESIVNSGQKNVVVLGGRRTINSGYFQKSFKKISVEGLALVAQPLSALIERGQINSSDFENIVRKLHKKSVVELSQPARAVLLACTHYPAARQIFQKVFNKARILDPGLQLVESLQLNKKVSSHLKNKKLKSEIIFWTTGSVKQSNQSAEIVFKLKKLNFQKWKMVKFT